MTKTSFIIILLLNCVENIKIEEIRSTEDVPIDPSTCCNWDCGVFKDSCYGSDSDSDCRD